MEAGKSEQRHKRVLTCRRRGKITLRPSFGSPLLRLGPHNHNGFSAKARSLRSDRLVVRIWVFEIESCHQLPVTRVRSPLRPSFFGFDSPIDITRTCCLNHLSCLCRRPLMHLLHASRPLVTCRRPGGCVPPNGIMSISRQGRCQRSSAGRPWAVQVFASAQTALCDTPNTYDSDKLVLD